MNREIKFRGKIKNSSIAARNGEWVEGFLTKIDNSPRYYITIMRGVDVPPYTMTYEIDHESIGQYTGLKNKEGEEIYEGDIVTDSSGILYEVRLGKYRDSLVDDFCFGFFMQRINTKEQFVFYFNQEYAIVKGNIFENPELLKPCTK